MARVDSSNFASILDGLTIYAPNPRARQPESASAMSVHKKEWNYDALRQTTLFTVASRVSA